MKPALLVVFVGLGCANSASPTSRGSPPPLASSAPKPTAAGHGAPSPRQLVVSVADSWASTKSRVFRFEESRGRLAPVGEPFDAILGRSGLGWGRGASRNGPSGPQKREGDGRSPAGVFAFGNAFGRNAPTPLGWPFLRTTPTLRCIDDANHPNYGEIVEPSAAIPSFVSAETMQPSSGVYDLGIVIEHNPAPAERGAGSCIFLHLAARDRAPTSGCTALRETELTSLLSWLDPERNPLFVQLPKSELPFAEETLALERGTLGRALAR